MLVNLLVLAMGYSMFDYYQEIFNDWDASPVRKKDLDPELVHYLESSSGEISRKNKLTIHFSLPINQKDKKNSNLKLEIA